MPKWKGANWHKPVREPYHFMTFEEVMELNGFELGNDPPPPLDLGDAKATPSVLVDNGHLKRDILRTDAVCSGTLTDENACGLRVVAYDGSTGGLYVSGAGTHYTLEDAVISLSGDGAGVGGKSAGAAVENHASLLLRRCVIDVSGANRTATSAYQHATLRAEDSTLISHGAPYGASAPEPVTSVTPPPILEIEGNCRTHCVSGNSASYFDRCTIIADGWAALSTDMSAGYTYLEANDCRVAAVKSGYCVYADWGCHDVIRRSRLDSACMAVIQGGNSDVLFQDCVMDCGSYLALMHCVMGSYVEVGELTLENCNVSTGDAVLLVKSQNVIVELKHCEVTSKSGILLKTMVNPDPMRTKVNGRSVYGCHIKLTHTDVTGDVIHQDPERSAYLYLNSSVLRGAVHNATVIVDKGGKWIATGDSEVVLGSDFEDGQIDAGEGITIHAKGGETGIYTLPSGGKLELVEVET